MGEISINIALLEEKIGKLQQLKADCEALSIVHKDMVGAGQSTELVNDIREEYNMLKEAMVMLVSNAIGFFTGIKDSAVDADNQSADKISR